MAQSQSNMADNRYASQSLESVDDIFPDLGIKLCNIRLLETYKFATFCSLRVTCGTRYPSVHNNFPTQTAIIVAVLQKCRLFKHSQFLNSQMLTAVNNLQFNPRSYPVSTSSWHFVVFYISVSIFVVVFVFIVVFESILQSYERNLLINSIIRK